MLLHIRNHKKLIMIMNLFYLVSILKNSILKDKLKKSLEILSVVGHNSFLLKAFRLKQLLLLFNRLYLYFFLNLIQHSAALLFFDFGLRFSKVYGLFCFWSHCWYDFFFILRFEFLLNNKSKI